MSSIFETLYDVLTQCTDFGIFMAILSKTTEEPEAPEDLTFGQGLETYLQKHERKRESLEGDCHTKLRKMLTIQICPLQTGL
jgi:hypothetical protein